MLRNEDIRQHMREGGTCSTASMIHLLYPHEPVSECVKLVKQNPSIENIAFGVALGYLEQEMFCFVMAMNEKESLIPSVFFSGLVKDAASDPDGACFVGGLVRMNIGFSEEGKRVGHVVSIRDLDMAQNTASLVDVGPIQADTDPLRVIALPLIDSLVTHLDVGSVIRVVGITAMPLTHPMVLASENRPFVEQSIQSWKDGFAQLQQALSG